MDYLELEDFENMAASLSKYDTCNARLIFWAIRDHLDGMDLKNEFNNFVSGVGIIEFDFISQSLDSKTYKVKFARIKGFDIDVKEDFENFKIYAKEFISDFSKKIGIPIVLKGEEISSN